jgi:photosystem II stability/assembly factor-like uncharacterized protein
LLSTAQAQETVVMSVLSSRKHRLNVSDNPVVGVFISTDAGDSWGHRGWKEYIRTFYTAKDEKGVLWSACGNGVLRSVDGGARWTITTGWEITEVLKVAVDPLKPGTVFAATAYGIFKTTDDGKTWREKKIGLRMPFTSDVVIDRSNSNRIFAATEEGILRSTDGGDSWSSAGLKGLGVRIIVQDPSNPGRLWAGTQDDGVFGSSDGGRTWRSSNGGLGHKTVYAIAVHPTNSSVVYLGTHGGGVYRTEDGGRKWEQRVSGLGNPDVHSLLVLRSDPAIVFAGTLNGGLFRSRDGGKTWQFNSQDEGQVWGLSSK